MPDDHLENDEYTDLLKRHDGTHWMYFTSKPRCEKKLYEALRQQGIPCYLPLVKKTTEYSHRIYTRQVPMFGGYVFASTCPGGFDMVKVNSSLLQVHFLDDISADRLLQDLITVRKVELLAGDHKVEFATKLKIEMPVIINRGYFKGEYGKIQHFVNHDNVMIRLTSLSMVISIQLPVDFVEKSEC